MKKNVFMALAIMAMLASCSKNADNAEKMAQPTLAPEVEITLIKEQPSRAFFDNTATAEDWEKEITMLTVYVYDQSGNIIVTRSMTDNEIITGSARISLPNSAAGTSCIFYAVANSDYGDVATATAMDALTERTTLDEYNGTVDQTMDTRKRAAGFVMTGKSLSNIASAGNSTTVPITLKRLVAKIAVRAKLSDDFSANYNGGEVVITSAETALINTTCYSFYNSSYNNSVATPTYTCEQITRHINGNFDNLFYAYESRGYVPLNAGPYIKLKGYFDADGSDTTITDRSEVNYMIFPDTVNGEISRNAYYRIDATIKGLSGDGIIVNFTVSDWETPVTQTVDLGV
jgi:hypothetical protein